MSIIHKENMMDFYGFYTGKIFDAYKYLGAHVEEKGVTFRTFAPSASRITLIGEFNDWQEWEMNKVSDGNFWECYVPQAKAGQEPRPNRNGRRNFRRNNEGNKRPERNTNTDVQA